MSNTSNIFFNVFVCLFKRDNAHQLTFSVYTQNVNMPVSKKANFRLYLVIIIFGLCNVV